MKKFLLRFTFFIFSTVISYVALYYSLTYFALRKELSNTIYIYGDSQTVQGVDLNLLSSLTNLKVYSSARHGSGIYDFLFFTEKVPENSKIILGISEHSQIRPNKFEANTSPLDFFTLKELYHLDYPVSDLKLTIRKGLKPPFSSYFKTKHHLYPTLNTINHHTSIESFIERYSTITEQTLKKKQNMYLYGIQKLIEKNCALTFIEFPYHYKLKNTVERTKFNYCFNDFKTNVKKKFSSYTIDTLFLESDRTLMYDYTHLNKLGAKILTQLLAHEIITTDEETKYILFDTR